MALVTRLGKGSPLTAQEMDDNLVYLESSISVGTSGTSGTSGTRGTGGTSGSSGVSGSAGSSGTSGSSGTGGSSGSSGVSGSAGSSGTSGSSGVSGSAGSSGTSGSSGISGTSGSSGVSGSAGSSGTSGTSISLMVSSGMTTLTDINKITLTGFSLSPSGSGGAEIINTGGDGSTSSLTFREGSLSIPNITDITVEGLSINVSGSNGITLLLNSQNIRNLDIFAELDSSNTFVGNQTVSGSIIAQSINSDSLTIQTNLDLPLTEGHVFIGAVGNRAITTPVSSLGLSGSNSLKVIDANLNTEFSNINTIKLESGFLVQSSGSSAVSITATAGTSGGGVGFPFTGSAEISGSLNVTDSVSIGGDITASSVSISSVGVPEIESETNINLTAGNAVVVTSSVLRLSSFTNAQTGSLIVQNGDIIYNSTIDKFVGFASGSWVELH